MKTNKESLKNHLIPGRVELVSGSGGFPLLRLRAMGAVCEVYPYGAHVAGFKPAGRKDLLWMSPYSNFEEEKPIRGGIPLCFPWFGPHRTRKDLPLHGFVRMREWELTSTAILKDGRTRISFACADTEDSRTVWPFPFRLEYSITVGESLELDFLIHNTGQESFTCDEGLHSYFGVSDSGKCEIPNFDGVGYIDRVRGDARAIQSGTLRLSGETVNAYMHAPEITELVDYTAARKIRVEQMNMASTVVWNPGELAGLGNPEIRETWNQYVCIESTNCLDCSLIVDPGSIHSSHVRLSVENI